MLNVNVALEYTVPFMLAGVPLLNIDKVNVASKKQINRGLFSLLKEKISLDEYGDNLPSAAARDLIAGQYDVCLNYIYANPIWEKLRNNNAPEILLAYIIETRHYLAAASSRMSAGLAFSWQTTPMSFILSEHLIEEADHAVFFENALEHMGCSKEIIALFKPAPVTLEWIFLMRAISSRHPVVSAVCSGLMETSAKNREAVRGWHELLMTGSMIERETVEKFYEHVKLDIELGHGSCWEDVLLSNDTIPTDLLKETLNSVTIVAEMLDRWFTSLETGLSGIMVQTALTLKPAGKKKNRIQTDSFFNGNPVFSSSVLHEVVHGRQQLSDTVSKIMGIHYFLSDPISSKDRNTQQVINSAAAIGKEVFCFDFLKANGKPVLSEIFRKWMMVVDGHPLWAALTNNPTVELAYGYILENYHYLNASIAHTASVIYSCPVESIRTDYVKHLAEEEKHGELLKKTLKEFDHIFFETESFRPLPTTLAFIGFLKELAMTDWKAYTIALAFLQFTLEGNSTKHARFYETAGAKSKKVRTLLRSIRTHDELDAGLNHEEDILKLMAKLEGNGMVSSENLQRASMICSLCWSFLDGIRCHYTKINSVNQRIGWSHNGSSWN
jgi:pyrroloquinoline quinone (PQQ) biosynthesis protein C